MELADFDFDLPEERIARFPADRRDESRLMVIDRATGTITHARFSDLPDLVDPSWLMVMNDARVLPARLFGKKAGSGGKVELLLVEELEDPRVWRAIAGASKPLREGAIVELEGGATAKVRAREAEGFVTLELSEDGASIAERSGALPLPPYMRRDATALDRERYQTVYADRARARSVAAPTAGLHFTPELLARLEARGVERATVTLDVGPGTFLPVRAARVEDHVMHEERFRIPDETAHKVERAAEVLAVGTTAVRALESWASGERGATRLFMRPGYTPKVVDHLITNFHLPRSTLLMLVACFVERERLLEAYREAIALGYRFYSYGDAMLVR